MRGDRCKAKVIVDNVERQCYKKAIIGDYCCHHDERDFEFDIPTNKNKGDKDE